MINRFCKMPLWECSTKLADVAMGRAPADMVITNAKLVNVCTHEIQENIGVAISCGRIALVGDAAHCIGPDTKVIDAEGQYITPGLLDGHMHIESSMLSANEYATAVVPHGTTGVYYDPHEICNVLGIPGVELMIRDAARTPLKAMLTSPSCVPAVPGFEDSGCVVTSEDIAREMQRDEVVGLGEMMNFPGIVGSAEETHKITGNTLKADKVVTGHYSIPETGRGLNAYVASGVRCCHESTRAEDVLAKMRLGMYAQLREGSAWHDLGVICKAITEHQVDSRFACMISDDTHPFTLARDGHLDHIIRRAISFGIDPITAVQMVTINTATCYRMDHELGSVTPGKCADIVFVKDLEHFEVTRVIIDGEVAAENGRLSAAIEPLDYPEWAMNTMHVGETITPETFRIPTEKKDKATVRVIEIIPAHVSDIERRAELKVVNGCLESDTEQDVLKTFVFERHHNTGKHGVGFVKGFHITCGAMASTVAHDAHNLLVVGSNDEDMALAANTLIQCGGGMCAVSNGKVLGLVRLPLAGLMNPKPNAEVAADVEQLTKAWAEIGCNIVSPFMTMALIPLACLPDLRLTDRGLVDCNRFTFVPLEAEE
ncbi:MAG: adenine deaminase [Oscillospiraceae bacterium]|nr:adenine deaminase [Oscillospiraceae bacterium]